MLYISKSLRALLRNIENNSVVAKDILYATHNELVSKYNNYLNIAHDDVSKISSLTRDAHSKFDKSNNQNDINEYTSKLRVSTRPGALIKNLLVKKYSEKELEDFTNLYKAQTQVKGKIKIVEGEIIKHYYLEKSYIRTNSGSLFASCMRQEHKSEFFNLYTNNQDIIKLVILHDDNNDKLIYARALLWHLEDGTKIMDRVYSNNDDVIIPFLQKWGTDNGYYVRKTQKWNDSLTFITPSGNVEQIKFSLKLKNKVFNKYPYLDTFKFYDYLTNEFSNYREYGNSEINTLICTEGTYMAYNYLHFDILEKCYYKKSDMIFLEYLGGMIKKDKSDNMVYCDILQQYIMPEHVVSIYNENMNVPISFVYKNVYDMIIPKVKDSIDIEHFRILLNLSLKRGYNLNISDSELNALLESNDINTELKNYIK